MLLPAMVAQDGFVISHTQMASTCPSRSRSTATCRRCDCRTSDPPRSTRDGRRQHAWPRETEHHRQQIQEAMERVPAVLRRGDRRVREGVRPAAGAARSSGTDGGRRARPRRQSTRWRARCAHVVEERRARRARRSAWSSSRCSAPSRAPSCVAAIGRREAGRRPRPRPLARLGRHLLERGRGQPARRADVSCRTTSSASAAATSPPSSSSGIIDDLAARERRAPVHLAGGDVHDRTQCPSTVAPRAAAAAGQHQLRRLRHVDRPAVARRGAGRATAVPGRSRPAAGSSRAGAFPTSGLRRAGRRGDVRRSPAVATGMRASSAR